MRRRRDILILLILCFFGISLAQSSTRQISTAFPPYLYIHDRQDSILVKKLHHKIQPYLQRMRQFLGNPSPHTLTIVLTRSEDEYYQATQNAAPEWSQAVVFPRKKLIFIKISTADDLLQSPQTLLHEIAHIRVDERCLGARLPAWLNEGLAQYCSGELLTIQKKILLSKAILTKDIINLSGLDSLMQFQRPQAELAYAQSLSAIDYIIFRHGEPALLDLLQAFSEKQSVNFALTSALGYDYIDFENEWYEYIHDKYRWLILLNFDNFLWLAIAVLIILAILMVRWRNRIKLKKWEEEEKNIYFEENV